MEEIILYSTGCPKCKVLKSKLDKSGLAYSTCTDVDKMEELGIQSVPVLSVGEKLYDFTEAVKLINDLKERNDNEC